MRWARWRLADAALLDCRWTIVGSPGCRLAGGLGDGAIGASTSSPVHDPAAPLRGSLLQRQEGIAPGQRVVRLLPRVVVFNSTAHRGTHAQPRGRPADIYHRREDARDISVVGCTGNFFMARGVATRCAPTASTRRGPRPHYFSEFRLQMDIKLHECYLALIKPKLLCIALHGLLLHYCCQSLVLGWVSTSSYLYV